MQKHLFIFIFIFFFSFSLSSTSHAMLTVGEAKQLLQESLQDEVHPCDGCSNCPEGGECSYSSCCFYCVSCTVSSVAVVAAAGSTGGAFPDQGRPDFNPTAFRAGMGLWGTAGCMKLFTPIIHVGVNWIRNYFVQSSNDSITALLNDLDEVSPHARAIERHVKTMGNIILDSNNTTTLRKLDAGQILILSLVDLERFKDLIKSNIFDPNEMKYSIKLIQILDMTEEKQNDTLYSKVAIDWFKEQPTLYYVLQQLLPTPSVLPHIQLPDRCDEYSINERQSEKTGYISIPMCNDADLLDLDHVVADLPKADINLEIKGKIIPARKKKLAQISLVLDSALKEYNEEYGLQKPLPFVDEKWKYIEEIVYFSNLSQNQKDHYVITRDNLEHLLELHEFYDIPFLRERLDDYHVQYGVFGNGLKEKLEFAYKYQLQKTKEFQMDRLTNILNTFAFHETQMDAVAALHQEDRRTLFERLFKWEDLYTAFEKNPSLLKTLWTAATRYKIQEITTELIRYGKEDPRATTVIAWAFDSDTPQELEKTVNF